MRLVDRWNRHPVAAAAALGALLGTVIGLALPIRSSAATDPAAATWTLPPPGALQRFDEANFARVRSARLWGPSGSGTANREREVEQWRLTGIIADPVPTALVFADGSRTATPLRVGDKLPDDGRITRITGRSIVYERDGCFRERALYSVPAPAGQCISPEGTPAGPPAPIVED